jgi:hypothetical protein
MFTTNTVISIFRRRTALNEEDLHRFGRYLKRNPECGFGLKYRREPMAKARPRIGQDDDRSGSLLVILFYPTWPLITLGIVFALTEVAEQREMLQAVGHNAATVYAKSSDTQRRLHNRFWFNNLEFEDTEITGHELPTQIFERPLTTTVAKSHRSFERKSASNEAWDEFLAQKRTERPVEGAHVVTGSIAEPSVGHSGVEPVTSCVSCASGTSVRVRGCR